MIKYLKTFGKKLWEDLDLFFDEKNRQIIIHSKKVKPSTFPLFLKVQKSH